MKRMTLLLLCAFILLPLISACGDGSGGGGLGNVYVYGGNNSGAGNDDNGGTNGRMDANGDNGNNGDNGSNGNGDNSGNNGNGTDNNGGNRGAGNGNDEVSLNALEGSWFYYDGWFSAYLWRFDPEGNYVRFIVTQSGYTNDVGTTWYSAYGDVMTGKYRVSGYTIYFHDSQHSSQFARDYNIGSVPPHNTAVNQLPPLSKPGGVDDFRLDFEFIDTMNLRLVTDDPTVRDNYEAVFEYYDGESHDVAVPAHTIPTLAWPKDLLHPEILEYGAGRIRYIDTMSKNNEVDIKIDMTTGEAFMDYIDNMLRLRWSLSYPSEFDELKQGVRDRYIDWLKKDNFEIYVFCDIDTGFVRFTADRYNP